jgi:hypothetical protein
MEEEGMSKFLKLEIEDLEERIAPGLTLTVGLNSPQGTHTVVGPDAATGGAVTAFTAVSTSGPGDIANIDVNFVC